MDKAKDTERELDREAGILVNQLRITLGSLGVKLPSLGRDFGMPPLIVLGNCNLATARALLDVLREVPERRPAGLGAVARAAE
ncbi:hypothetical protein I3F58_12650 [Streptomyces sp. MUM 203J]|uniref:hypothetical protein n=1 Tax=Streptomyces sp. MUM 203J TaxID=2791990 RepID=UPI001F04E4A4|nr:hypothetical protein [Streptomyces sp. MUM 203J]MCH0540404.1 hypothetical protein [Streptomyces sp. MUM 203J]